MINEIKIKVKLLKDNGAFYIILGSYLSKFVSLFGSIFLVRILTKTKYGILSYYENITSYFVILLGYGLAAGLQRYIVLAEEKGQKKACYYESLQSGTIWNLLLVVLCFLYIFLIPHRDSFSNYKYIGYVLAICLPFEFVINLSMTTMRGLFLNKKYAIYAFLYSSALILFRIFGAIIDGLEGCTWLKFACYLVFAAIGFVLLFFYFKKTPIVQNSKVFVKEKNKYSVQMMFVDGLWAIFMLNDVFILGHMLGDEALLADYRIAYVIPANLSILVAAFNIFVTPYYTKYDKDHEIKKRNMLFIFNVSGTVILMGVAVIFCMFFARVIINTLYGEEYYSAVPIMKVLLVASFFNNGIRYPIANTLSAIGKQKSNLIIGIISIVLQIVLDILLISVQGVKGLAIASVFTFVFMSILMILVAFKEKLFFLR